MSHDGQSIIGKNLKCIRDAYKINLLQLRAGVSACKLRRNVNKNDERTVAMVKKIGLSLSHLAPEILGPNVGLIFHQKCII